MVQLLRIQLKLTLCQSFQLARRLTKLFAYSGCLCRERACNRSIPGLWGNGPRTRCCSLVQLHARRKFRRSIHPQSIVKVADSQPPIKHAGGMGMEPPKPAFTVYLRYPYKRGSFQDTSVDAWDEEKEQKLWRVLLQNSSTRQQPFGRQNETSVNWGALAEDFQVTERYLLQQAAWLYNHQLQQVRSQIQRGESTNSLDTTGSKSAEEVSGSIEANQLYVQERQKRERQFGQLNEPQRQRGQASGVPGLSHQSHIHNEPTFLPLKSAVSEDSSFSNLSDASNLSALEEALWSNVHGLSGTR